MKKKQPSRHPVAKALFITGTTLILGALAALSLIHI